MSSSKDRHPYRRVELDIDRLTSTVLDQVLVWGLVEGLVEDLELVWDQRVAQEGWGSHIHLVLGLGHSRSHHRTRST